MATQTTRNATVRAEGPVRCFTLSKWDYEKTVYDADKLRKSKNLAFLNGMRFFKGWQVARVQLIN